MADDAWYWGVVLRAAPVDGLLQHIEDLRPPPGVHPQAVGTGHVTLFYAPLRGPRGDRDLARRTRPVAERTEPFDVELRGLGEFVSAHRVVAWLGVGNGAERLRELRAEICSLDRDSLPHSFHPHCTLAYGDDPVAYAGFREVLRREVGKVRVRLQVDSIWVAGFRSGTHPARALGYRVELPFGAVAGTGTAPAAS